MCAGKVYWEYERREGRAHLPKNAVPLCATLCHGRLYETPRVLLLGRSDPSDPAERLSLSNDTERKANNNSRVSHIVWSGPVAVFGTEAG